MTKAEEKILVRKAQKNPEAFGKIFDTYYQEIFGYIVRRTANVHVAKDIASDVFYKAMKNLWKFKWRNISLAAWLYRIATNEINYYYRQKKRKTEFLDRLKSAERIDPPSRKSVEKELIEAEEELQRNREFINVQKNLLELPEIYQEVIALKYFESKMIREISEITGRKPGTVKSQLSRGINLLRALSEKQ